MCWLFNVFKATKLLTMALKNYIHGLIGANTRFGFGRCKVMARVNDSKFSLTA